MQHLVVVLLVGLAASAYGLDLSHAARSAEIEPRVFDFLADFYAQVVFPPLNRIVTDAAHMAAQLLAGLSAVGLPAPGGRTIQPSEAQLRGFFDDLWANALKPQLEQTLSGLTLAAAGALAHVGVNGIDLSSIFAGIGKRDVTEAEMRGIEDIFSDIFASIFKKPIESALSNSALMLAQVLAGVGTNGVDLSSIFGGRAGTMDLASRQAELRGIFDGFGDAMLNALNHVWTNILQQPLQGALQTGALMGAQLLAGLGTSGISIGKRDLTAEQRGIFDDMMNFGTNLVQTQVKPVIESLLNNAVIQLAGVLANFSQSGSIGRR